MSLKTTSRTALQIKKKNSVLCLEKGKKPIQQSEMLSLQNI